MITNCPANLHRIRWREANADWQEIVGADDYAISQKQGQCPTGYRIYFDLIYRGSLYKRDYGTHYGKITSIDWRQNPNGTNNKLYIDIYGGTYRNQNANILVRSLDPGGYTPWDDFTVTKIERVDGQPDNCGDCTFAVTKNGEVVHAETYDVCPEVEEYCADACPEGTCECDCGNYICCYDQQGNVVQSIRK